MSRAWKSLSHIFKESSRSQCSRGDFFGEIPTRDMRAMEEKEDGRNVRKKSRDEGESLTVLWRSQPSLSSTEYGTKRRKLRTVPKIPKDGSRSPRRKGIKVRGAQNMGRSADTIPLSRADAASTEHLRESYRRGSRTRLLLRSKIKSAYLFNKPCRSFKDDDSTQLESGRRGRSRRSIPRIQSDSRSKPRMSSLLLSHLQHTAHSIDLQQSRSEHGETFEMTDTSGEELRSTSQA
eukprot:jgi/Bigna1/90319/estExt_fgenesh1_pg.C_670056